jgi:hypothetical protein
MYDTIIYATPLLQKLFYGTTFVVVGKTFFVGKVSDIFFPGAKLFFW